MKSGQADAKNENALAAKMEKLRAENSRLREIIDGLIFDMESVVEVAEMRSRSAKKARETIFEDFEA